MLVLTRHYDEELVIRLGGQEVVVKVREFHGQQVKVCVTAPEEVEVIRPELVRSMT